MQYVFKRFQDDTGNNALLRAIDLSSEKIDAYIKKITKRLVALSKQKARGVWYITFGSGVTDLGGFGNGRMVIDLMHPKSTAQYIQFILPHEINHQIFDFSATPDSSAKGLYRCINEGFAVYMHRYITQSALPLETYFQYTKEELLFCQENEELIFNKLQPFLLTNNPDHALALADRGQHIFKKGPGAIGYYVGFKICESYVNNNGPNSWRDIYTMSVRDILAKTKYAISKG